MSYEQDVFELLRELDSGETVALYFTGKAGNEVEVNIDPSKGVFVVIEKLENKNISNQFYEIDSCYEYLKEIIDIL